MHSKKYLVKPHQCLEMKIKLGHYIAILFTTLVYLYAIIEKALGWTDYSVKFVLRNNTIFILVVLGVIYLINKYFLKKDLNVFILRKEKFIIYLVVGLLLLSTIYLINSIGRLTYYSWFTRDNNLPIHDTIREILDNKIYAFILLGPFVWFTEVFGVITKVFLLNSLWKLNKSKLWHWIGIVFVASLFALLQIDKGIADILNVFLIVSISNIFYLKFRNSIPLIIATILYTTIDLISFWVYNY